MPLMPVSVASAAIPLHHTSNICELVMTTSAIGSVTLLSTGQRAGLRSFSNSFLIFLVIWSWEEESLTLSCIQSQLCLTQTLLFFQPLNQLKRTWGCHSQRAWGSSHVPSGGPLLMVTVAGHAKHTQNREPTPTTLGIYRKSGTQ